MLKGTRLAFLEGRIELNRVFECPKPKLPPGSHVLDLWRFDDHFFVGLSLFFLSSTLH